MARKSVRISEKKQVKSIPPRTPAKTKQTPPRVPEAVKSGMSDLKPLPADEVTPIYELLLPAFTPLFSGYYSVEWEYRGKKEKYVMHARDIHEMAQDIVLEHPRTWEYREACLALIREEGKYYENEYEYTSGTYRPLRASMLDLSTPGGYEVLQGLIALGPNPTQDLSDDEKTCKYLCNCLVNKLWRTRKDFDARLTATDIREKMLSDLKRNALMSLQTNSYIYAALREHAISL